MKSYKVYVQDKYYKTIENKNAGEILAIIANDIKNNSVPDFDHTKDQNVRIEPIEEVN